MKNVIGIIRDRIKAISYVQLKSNFYTGMKNLDVIYLLQNNSFYVIEVLIIRNNIKL